MSVEIIYYLNDEDAELGRNKQRVTCTGPSVMMSNMSSNPYNDGCKALERMTSGFPVEDKPRCDNCPYK